MTEQRQFPEAGSVDFAIGWKLDYQALMKTKELANEDDDTISLEDVEAVVMALAKLGYVTIAR
jgi:hypothetical protein